MGQKFRTLLDRLRRSEDGSVTIEYVLWVPIWLALFGIATDATILMHQQLQLTVAARDASRQVALGRQDPEAMEDILESMNSGVDGFDAKVVVLNGYVTTTVGAPFESYTLFTGAMTGGTIAGSVSMWIEESGV